MKFVQNAFIFCLLISSLMLTSEGLCANKSQAFRLVDIVDQSWAQDELWNDGKAEVATYSGERVIYGEARAHEMTLITVYEEFNKEFWTKADWPFGQKPLLPVIKQNQLATIPTPNYPYHYMTSVFFDRGQLDNAVKIATNSQDWCGVTYREFQLYRNPPVMEFNSYWDGQGSGSAMLKDVDENVFFEEELPLLVRALKFKDGLEADFFLEPIQVTNKTPIPKPSQARLTVKRPSEPIKVPIGEFPVRRSWIVSVDVQDGRFIEFSVVEDTPNALVKMDFNDGRHYELITIERRQYWNMGE